jgi:hypothetical protein
LAWRATEGHRAEARQAERLGAGFVAFARRRGPHHLRTAVLLTGDWHTAADLVQTCLATGLRAGPRELPEKDVATYLTRKALAMGPIYRAVATLHAPAEQVATHLGDIPYELEPIDERTCRLHSHADTLEWLASRLIMLGCEFQVHEPPELAKYLRALAARVTRAAGDLP